MRIIEIAAIFLKANQSIEIAAIEIAVPLRDAVEFEGALRWKA